jgi:hypothetical protein
VAILGEPESDRFQCVLKAESQKLKHLPEALEARDRTTASGKAVQPVRAEAV